MATMVNSTTIIIGACICAAPGPSAPLGRPGCVIIIIIIIIITIQDSSKRGTVETGCSDVHAVMY